MTAGTAQPLYANLNVQRSAPPAIVSSRVNERRGSDPAKKISSNAQ